jgi:large subunit ribosomal protein L9
MATAIRVLLQADVDNLGRGGDIVRVRPGFARNYLLPRGLAVPATEGNLARVEELKRAAEQRAAQEAEVAKALAAKLGELSVEIQRAVGDESKMYGSVTAKDIEDAFAKLGAAVDRKKIQLSEPIKQLGTFDVPVKLHSTVIATLKVNVVKKTN